MIARNLSHNQIVKVKWTFKYTILSLVSLFLIECKEPVTNLETAQIEILKLGPPSKQKSIEIEFPFKVSIENNIDGWRCTGNQPYCKTYKSNSLAFRFCHLYTNQNEAIPLKTKEDKNNFANSSLQHWIKDDSKMYAGPHNSRVMPIEFQETDTCQILQWGYIIDWPEKSLFNKNYFWSTEHEYLGLEISAIADSPFEELDYAHEIDFIISNLKGIPRYKR